jgi:putative flippase GtrA
MLCILLYGEDSVAGYRNISIYFEEALIAVLILLITNIIGIVSVILWNFITYIRRNEKLG